jgi:hypothetical protein
MSAVQQLFLQLRKRPHRAGTRCKVPKNEPRPAAGCGPAATTLAQMRRPTIEGQTLPKHEDLPAVCRIDR